MSTTEVRRMLIAMLAVVVVLAGGFLLGRWFTEDFTLAELKTLHAKERLPDIRQENTLFDERYRILTFQEVIDLRDKLSHQFHRHIGLLPELKHSTYFSSIGLDLETPFVRTLRANALDGPASKTVVQSFEVSNLRALRQDWRVRIPTVLTSSRSWRLSWTSSAPTSCR